MRTRGKGDPKSMVEKAISDYAKREVREKLKSLPHPSQFMAKMGRTLADYVDAKLGEDSQLSLRAKLATIYEISRALEGGTSGELRDAARETEARKALKPNDEVFSRKIPGKLGAVRRVTEEGVVVFWGPGEETTETALSLAPKKDFGV